MEILGGAGYEVAANPGNADSYSGAKWHLDRHGRRVWPGAIAAADERSGTTDDDAEHRVYDCVAVSQPDRSAGPQQWDAMV